MTYLVVSSFPWRKVMTFLATSTATEGAPGESAAVPPAPASAPASKARASVAFVGMIGPPAVPSFRLTLSGNIRGIIGAVHQGDGPRLIQRSPLMRRRFAALMVLCFAAAPNLRAEDPTLVVRVRSA